MVKELFRDYPGLSWTGVVGTLGLLVTILTAAARIGENQARIDQKVDKVTYEADIGQIKGDIRVIKAAVCSKTPAACQQ